MHFQTALVIPILAIGALATYKVEGSESDLKAVRLVTGTRVTNDLYTHCTERTEIDGQVVQGEDCFANALRYMIQVLSDVHGSNRFVALLSNTVSGVQSIAAGPENATATGDPAPSTTTTAMTPKLKREDDNAMKAVLSDLNDHIRRRSEGGHRPRVVHIGHSNIHPTNGLAVRTNVHSGDATLHVHTNGSHATASFDKDESSPLGRRDDKWAPGSRFRFEGAQGLKLQIIADHQQDYGVLDPLLMKLAHGEGQMAPRLKESDSWAFALCRKSDNKRMLAGKLIAEDNGAGYDLENIGVNKGVALACGNIDESH